QAAIRMPAESTSIATNIATGGPICNTGATFACDALERAIWQLGTLENGQAVRMLAPGQGVTVNIPGLILTGQNAPPPGAIVVLEADVIANDGTKVLNRDDVVVKTARALDVELDPRPQPVASGDDLHYTVTFGNRSMSTVTDAVLSLPLPDGTTFGS